MTNQHQYSSFLKLTIYLIFSGAFIGVYLFISNVINMQPFMDKLNKMLISNINKHDQKILNSYFCSV